MKKVYMKPTMKVIQIGHTTLLTGSGKGVYGKVGEVDHPMLEEHFIEWIAIQTKQGNQRKALNPGEAPEAYFPLLEGDEVVAVYEYCNLHGLWKA